MHEINRIMQTALTGGVAQSYEIGLGHPEPEIAFEIELDRLQGEAFDVHAGLRSQWPFWARLSNALRFGRANKWFGVPEHEAFLRKCERHVTHGEPLPFVSKQNREEG